MRRISIPLLLIALLALALPSDCWAGKKAPKKAKAPARKMVLVKQTLPKRTMESLSAPDLVVPAALEFASTPYFPGARVHEASLSLCTQDSAELLEPVLAELLKLPLEEVCTSLVPDLSSRLHTTDVCYYEPPEEEDFASEDYQEGDLMVDRGLAEPVLVSLGLTSYRMDPRAAKAVEHALTSFTGDVHDRFALYLTRSGRYVSMMRRILREEGIPEDMAYLPLIESGYSPIAYSRMKATGLWQFMKGTGKKYGLKIDPWVDERRDPEKSTRAAARYLRDLYGMFDSWSLAMAAYNAGEGRIMRALKKAKCEEYWDLLGTRHIRSETKNYVPRYIAARMIAEEPERYGFYGLEYHPELEYETVDISYQLSLDVVAQCAGVSTKEIKDLNPELRLWATPPVRSYTLRIPRGTRERFLASVDKVPHAKRITVIAYTVQNGDTISTISRKIGVAQDVLINYNSLGKRAFIRKGQTLLIPLSTKISKKSDS